MPPEIGQPDRGRLEDPPVDIGLTSKKDSFRWDGALLSSILLLLLFLLLFFFSNIK